MLSLMRIGARCVLPTVMILHCAGMIWAYAPPGGGGGGGGGPTPPAVRYSIHPITSVPTAVDDYLVGVAMNNSGMVVGLTSTDDNYPLIVVGGTVFRDNDINDIAAQYYWPLPAGFRIRTCTDVNELGVVVGSMGTDDRTQNAGFAIDTHLSSDPALWTFYHLPHLGFAYSVARAINDFGDIVASYQPLDSTARVPYLFNLYTPETEPTIIPYAAAAVPDGFNNFRQILFCLDGANPSVYEPGMPLLTLTDANYRSSSSSFSQLLNDAGVLAWRMHAKKGNHTVPVRRSISSGLPLQQLYSSSAYVKAINRQNDVLLSGDLLYHNEFGIVNLDNLILSSDPLRGMWINNGGSYELMTDRSSVESDPDDLRFPPLVGRVQFGGVQYMVLLIPGPQQ